MSWMLEGQHLESILITRLRYLGDVVMATVLLEVLRRGDPEVRLGFLAEKGHGQVLLGHPHLDNLHLLETRRRGSDAQARAAAHPAENKTALSPWEMISQLKNCQYDLAVDLFFNPRSAWLLRFSGITHRIAGTAGSRRFLYSHNVLPGQSPEKYQPLYKVAPGGLGEHLARLTPLVHKESGLPFLDWFEKEYSGRTLGPFLPRNYWAAQEPGRLMGLESLLENGPIILAPGATWPVKQWPLEHWKNLIQGLLERTNSSLLLVQPPGTDNPWSPLGDDIPASRGGLLPVIDLKQVLGVISQASLLVSADGGVMHTGVGLAVPTVALFGPTDPHLWFPYTEAGPFRVLTSKAHCAPCNLHQCDQFICMPDLLPEQVLNQCLAMLPEKVGGTS